MIQITEIVAEPREERSRPDYRVRLVDDQLRGFEGVFLLRVGGLWGSHGHMAALEVESFTLATLPHPDVRINAVLLREVPFGRWLAAAIGAASDLRDGRDTAIWTVDDPSAMAEVGTHVRGAPDYEAVARLYRISVREGKGSAAEMVADAFGVGRGLAVHWISKARASGLLGPGAPRELTEVQLARRRQVLERLARLRAEEGNGE